VPLSPKPKITNVFSTFFNEPFQPPPKTIVPYVALETTETLFDLNGFVHCATASDVSSCASLR
jgi:hypothetical protein